jgi:methionyl-tRNA synthetase
MVDSKTSCEASPNKINLVFSALPYAHGPLHLGRLMGSLLPADIKHRALLLRGQRSVFLTGSDMYGEGVLIKAKNLGILPQDLAEKYSTEFKKDILSLCIEPTRYGSTNEPEHHEFVREKLFYLKSRGYLYHSEGLQYYCETCKAFKNSRSTIIDCKACGAPVKDDVCEQCWEPNTISEGDTAACACCGSRVSTRRVQNLRVDISHSPQVVASTVQSVPKKYRRLLYTDTRVLPKEVLRYIEYGIRWTKSEPTPVVYVWIEALLSYLRLESELCVQQGTEVSRHFFIGKDNLFFHAQVLSTLYELLSKHVLTSSSVYVREYLLLGRSKMSSSTNTVGKNTIPELFGLGLNSDSIRLYCASVDPLNSDSEYKLKDLFSVHNTVYCNKFLNFLHRIKSITDSVLTLECLETPLLDKLSIISSSLISSSLNRAYQITLDLVDTANTLVAEYIIDKNNAKLRRGVLLFHELSVVIAPLTPQFSAMCSAVLKKGQTDLTFEWSHLVRYNRL